MTADDQPFIDYYGILQIDPSCDRKALGYAYHYLAKLYHPDHTETADATKFAEVIEAYRVLRNPARRAEYDLLHAAHAKQAGKKFSAYDEDELDEKDALADAEVHARILMFLYRRRRQRAQDAGVAAFYVQQMLNCSDETFDFHVWYLKSKGFIEITEQGTLAITVQGVDHVISSSRTHRTDKLLIGQSSDPRG